MSTEYNYDDQGQFFPYFIVTMLGLVLIPTTWNTLVSKDTKQKGHSLISTGFRPPRYDLIQAARRKIAKQEKNIKRFFIISAGWALFSYMLYLIVTTENVAGKIWDPYEILGISTSADEKAIKKHYKKLSLQYHPDKVKATGNETAEELNERFVQLTKAYKALTDEEIRNNYIQYGHPDGKQSFSIGIALPKWIVAEGNTYYVLAVYGILFGIILPYTVGKWWYGTRRFTKDGVLTESAGRLFKDYSEETEERNLVETLSLGEEMKEAVQNPHLWAHGEQATLEKKIAPVIGPKALETLNGLEGWRRQALALLWAYLYRIDLDDKLETVKLEVGTRSVALNKSFFAIALAYGNVLPTLSSLSVNQSLIQAIAPGESPLLQLPNFTPEAVKAAEVDAGRYHLTIQQFMAIPDDRRRKLLVTSKILSREQYDQAIAFAKKLPALNVEAAFFKVAGEKVVLPNSLVQFVVKARVIPPGEKATPVDPKDLLEEDEPEDDVNALIGRSDKKNAKPATIAYAHAPYYPKDHLPQWQLFLGDAKQDKIIIPPTAFTTFDSVTDSGVVTLKLQFQAPPQPGEYTFTMHLHSDSYLGIDTKKNVTMEVAVPEAAAPVEDDEISEPDEDSFAGQMAQMKGEKTSRKVRKHKHDSDDEDEDDESDTDGKSEEESETDTDTDTDEE